MKPSSSSAFCRRAIAVLESPTRSASSTWLARALAVSSDRIVVSMWSSFICFDSCAKDANCADFQREMELNHQDRKVSNPNLP
jgi:hypothetical protein